MKNFNMCKLAFIMWLVLIVASFIFWMVKLEHIPFLVMISFGWLLPFVGYLVDSVKN